MDDLLVSLTGMGDAQETEGQGSVDVGAGAGETEGGTVATAAEMQRPAAHHRLICVGFGLELKGKSYESAVELTRVIAIASPGERCGAEALYGDIGPRLLLEYSISPAEQPSTLLPGR